MAAYNSAPSLLHLCLDYYSNQPALLFSEHVSATFSTLPSSAIEHILESWTDQSQCNVHIVERIAHFVGLFGRKLRKLQINLDSRQQSAEGAPTVQRASAMLAGAFKCGLETNILRHLEVYDTFDTCQLREIVQNFHALTFLMIIVNNLDDRIIQAVAENCSNLREFHAFGMNFSDSALKLLCAPEMSANSSEQQQQQLPHGCPKLRRLVFYQDSKSRPKFGSSSVTTLLLCLEELYQLQIPHHVLSEALVSLMRRNKDTTRLHLTSLDVNLASGKLHHCLERESVTIKQFAGDVSDDDHGHQQFPGDAHNDVTAISHYARALTCLLPSLCKLTLTLNHECQLESLKVLSRCAHLTGLSLTIENSPFSIEQDEGEGEEDAFTRRSDLSLNRLLRRLPQLTDLELHNLAIIDVSGMGGMCSRLERLQISNVKWLHYNGRAQRERAEAGAKPQFSQLKQLLVCGHDDDSRLDERSLLELLTACHQIEALVVGWCAELSDQLMLSILERNPMLAIERLEFHELSDRFTIEVVRHIVFTRTRPLTLNIFSCNAICLMDVKALIEEIRTRNRNVLIKYYDL